MYRRMLRRDIFCKNPEAKLRGTVDFLFGDCIHCIYENRIFKISGFHP